MSIIKALTWDSANLALFLRSFCEDTSKVYKFSIFNNFSAFSKFPCFKWIKPAMHSKISMISYVWNSNVYKWCRTSTNFSWSLSIV